MTTELQLIYCNTPNPLTAETIARALVEQKLAACVNCLPAVQSYYMWEEQLHCETETTLVIKAPSSLYSVIEATIVELHPYDVPEIIATSITNGLPNYLKWVTESCASNR